MNGTRSTAAVAGEPVLEVRGLCKSFGGVRAVSGVGFSLPPGQVLAMIGPNGAGKTTCFNMLMGQVRPDAGSVRFAGREVTGLAPRHMWRLGVGRTFQIAATFASMTVIENVRMGLLAHHRRLLSLLPRAEALYSAEALALLEQTGMAGQAHRPCGVLAYGDLKRVELAMALTNGPRLLLMDEPTAGMSPPERVELMALVRRIVSRRGIGVLFIEHDMDVVFAHADRVIVLDRGEVIAHGPPAEVRANPQVREVYLGAGDDGGAPAPKPTR